MELDAAAAAAAGLHLHCQHCVKLSRCAQSPAVSGQRCDVIDCPAGCGHRLHECKLSEHRLLCPEQRVSERASRSAGQSGNGAWPGRYLTRGVGRATEETSLWRAYISLSLTLCKSPPIVLGLPVRNLTDYHHRPMYRGPLSTQITLVHPGTGLSCNVCIRYPLGSDAADLCSARLGLTAHCRPLAAPPVPQVPCINADYGCELVLARRLRASHLGSCPASVVLCMAEWNRWPLLTPAPATPADGARDSQPHCRPLGERRVGGLPGGSPPAQTGRPQQGLPVMACRAGGAEERRW